MFGNPQKAEIRDDNLIHFLRVNSLASLPLVIKGVSVFLSLLYPLCTASAETIPRQNVGPSTWGDDLPFEKLASAVQGQKKDLWVV